MHVSASAEKLAFTMSVTKDTAELTLSGPIGGWENSGQEFTRRVSEALKAGVQHANLYLNTPGGSVLDANEVVNQLQRFPGTLRIKVGALCASAGTVILLAAKKENRQASRNSMLMTHKPTASAFDLTAEKMRQMADALEKFEQSILQLYMQELGLSEEEARKLYEGDVWMTATEAKAKGFVSEIVGPAPTHEAKEARALLAQMQVPSGVLAAAGLLDLDTSTTPENDPVTMKLNAVSAKALALAVDASEDSINTAIAKLAQERDAALQAKAKAEQELAQAGAKAKAEALVDGLVASKKIAAAEREDWLATATANYDFAAKLAAKLVAPSALTGGLETPETDAGKGGAGTGAQAKTFSDLAKNDMAGLRKMHREDFAAFNKLYKAEYGVEADPKHF